MRLSADLSLTGRSARPGLFALNICSSHLTCRAQSRCAAAEGLALSVSRILRQVMGTIPLCHHRRMPPWVLFVISVGLTVLVCYLSSRIVG